MESILSLQNKSKDIDTESESETSLPPTPKSIARDSTIRSSSASSTLESSEQSNQEPAAEAPKIKKTRKRKSTSLKPEKKLDTQIFTDNPRHKWLRASEIKDLESQGIFIQKGQFTRTEEEELKSSVENFFKSRGLTPAQDNISRYLRRRKNTPREISKQQRNEFYIEIAQKFPFRTLNSIYDKMERLYNPLNTQKKPWQVSEKKQLVELVREFGKDWQKIGAIMMRLPENCRTQFRNLEEADMANENVESIIKNTPSNSQWTREETKSLIVFACQLKEIEIEPVVGVEFVRKLIQLDKLPYKALTILFNKDENCIRKRNSNQIRLRWTSCVVSNLQKMLDCMSTDEKSKVPFEDFVSLLNNMVYFNNHHNNFNNYNSGVLSGDDVIMTLLGHRELKGLEFDLALIDNIKKFFPKAKYLNDIKWRELVMKCEEYKTISHGYILQKRFLYLTERFFTGDTKFWYHQRLREDPTECRVGLWEGYEYLKQCVRTFQTYPKYAGQATSKPLVFECSSSSI